MLKTSYASAKKVLTLWVRDYWPVTVFQVGVFTLLAILLWRFRKSGPPFSYPVVPLLAAVVWGLAQIATGRTVYSFDTQSAVVRWATFLAVFLIGFELFRDRRVAAWFRGAMLWFAFLVAILATLQTFTTNKIFWLFTPPASPQAVMGPILYHTHYAVFVEIVLPFALYEAMRRKRGGFLYAGMAAVLYASVIASASRGGILLTSAEVAVAPALLLARGTTTGRVAGKAVLRMAVLFALFAAVVGWEHVWNRFLTPDPMTVRRELAVSSIHMIQAHPWSGVGLGAWPTAYPRYAIIDKGLIANEAHSDWLQWTAEGGIPLGIILVTLFGWSILPALRSVWGMGVIAVFLHATVDYPFSRPAMGGWTILVIAMLAAGTSTEKGRLSHGKGRGELTQSAAAVVRT